MFLKLECFFLSSNCEIGMIRSGKGYVDLDL